jgi:hypothetical protein
MAMIALAAASSNDPNRGDEEDLGGYSAEKPDSLTSLFYTG